MEHHNFRFYAKRIIWIGIGLGEDDDDDDVFIIYLLKRLVAYTLIIKKKKNAKGNLY